MNKFKLIIFLLFSCCIRIQSVAQVTVTSPIAEAPFDISARTEKRFDLNGMGCALIKLEIPVSGVTFEGSVIGDVNLNTNEYWVYLTDGTKRLKVHIPGQNNLLLEFMPLQSLRTYIGTIHVESELSTSVADAVMDYENRAKGIVVDTTIITNLRQEAFRYLLTTRDVSHIMLPSGKTPDEKVANLNKLDSIREAIMNGASFEDMAVKYSVDPAAKNNKGHMGYINSSSLPYPFIEAAYSTKIGGISAAFDDSPYGIHIVRVEGEKPNPGKYLVRHIMKMTNKLSHEDKMRKKSDMDVIYSKLMSGGDFEALAKAESEDSGSARNGGTLPWFGVGQMIPEFEGMVASLKNGQISSPFETMFGYHIVQRLDSRDLNYEEELPNIIKSIAKDVRAHEPKKDKLSKLRSLYGIKLNRNSLENAYRIIENGGGLNASTISNLRTDKSVLAKFGMRELTVSDITDAIPQYSQRVNKGAKNEFDRIVNEQLDSFTEEIVRIQLSSFPEILKHLND